MPWVYGRHLPRPERPRESSVPHVALVKFDFISLEERTKLLLKRLDSMMLALVADVGSNVFDLRLAHRECTGSRLPKEARKLRASAPKPVVRAFLEVADNVAERLGPCKEKQTVQMVGLSIDFDRETAEAFERAAHVGMEIGANLVRQGSFAISSRRSGGRRFWRGIEP